MCAHPHAHSRTCVEGERRSPGGVLPVTGEVLGSRVGGGRVAEGWGWGTQEGLGGAGGGVSAGPWDPGVVLTS